MVKLRLGAINQTMGRPTSRPTYRQQIFAFTNAIQVPSAKWKGSEVIID
jgi:hypothetical protein